MARTRFGASVGKQQDLELLLNGETVSCEAMPFRAGTVVLYLVKMPCEMGLVEKPSYFDFETGIRKNEYVWYLKECRHILFKWSAKRVPEMQKAVKEYIRVYFGNRKGKFLKCLRMMEESAAPGKARRIKEMFQRKYGLWQYGLHSVTQTVGKEALEARRDEFGYILDRVVRDNDITNEPRIAFHSCSEKQRLLLVEQHNRAVATPKKRRTEHEQEISADEDQ